MKYLFLSIVFLFPYSTEASTAEAKLTSPASKTLSARVILTEVPDGLKVTADVSGLKPGSVHGFHVHENGKCEGPGFKSAGNHFDPAEHNHGSPASGAKHMGDLGNLVANEKGIAKTEVIIQSKEKNSLGAYIGKSVIIHANPDDLTTQPSGNSGDRIACGVIATATTR
jgi:Cu-Zn family superoxide dismutase